MRSLEPPRSQRNLFKSKPDIVMVTVLEGRGRPTPWQYVLLIASREEITLVYYTASLPDTPRSPTTLSSNCIRNKVPGTPSVIVECRETGPPTVLVDGPLRGSWRSSTLGARRYGELPCERTSLFLWKIWYAKCREVEEVRACVVALNVVGGW